MTNEERAFKLMQDELGDRPPTPENVMEASIAATRQSIYLDYYYANPAVVEALLLNLRYFMETIFEEIDELGDAIEEEETERRIVKEMLKFSFAMRKTIDKLYSV
jgi:hypothetical protein